MQIILRLAANPPCGLSLSVPWKKCNSTQIFWNVTSSRLKGS